MFMSGLVILLAVMNNGSAVSVSSEFVKFGSSLV